MRENLDTVDISSTNLLRFVNVVCEYVPPKGPYSITLNATTYRVSQILTHMSMLNKRIDKLLDF